MAVAAAIFVCPSSAMSQTCEQVAGWSTLKTVASACRNAGFPLEQDGNIREGYDAFSARADKTSSEWKRGIRRGEEHGMRLFNAGVLVASPAYSCAEASKLANSWLKFVVVVACDK
jgi:hypothetical protein